MRVDDHVRERALLNIYRAHRKLHGCTLSARELERDWKRVQLRRSDLHQALDDLVGRQLLNAIPGLHGIDYELTYVGECAMRSAALTRPLVYMRSWITLQRARMRKPERAAGMLARRRRLIDMR